ncbi:MAG TPA: universal stress protein [Nitrospirae bacterium]|nr:hypothetical protein BMS3Abin06_00936 [bacterium BMS3Abin06]HDH13501.1 universal stress protein [Nitrospirota bacterium]HDZ01059.1 universal stress protein [Nitrospirota bacterium]
MKRWLRKFENAMAAVAFAEAGEFETAKESLKEERTILLALRGGEGDRNAFRYALNTCKRIGAGMEILYVSEIAAGLLKEFRSQLRKEGIDYGIIQKSGSLEQEIRNYTDAKGDILFVVAEVSEGVDIHNKKADKIIANAWKNLKCPLVVVSEGNTAFAS